VSDSEYVNVAGADPTPGRTLILRRRPEFRLTQSVLCLIQGFGRS